MCYYKVLVPWKKPKDPFQIQKVKYFYLGESLDSIQVEPSELNDFCNAKSLMDLIKHKELKDIIDSDGSTYINSGNDKYLEIIVNMNYNFIGYKYSAEGQIRKKINREIKLNELLNGVL